MNRRNFLGLGAAVLIAKDQLVDFVLRVHGYERGPAVVRPGRYSPYALVAINPFCVPSSCDGSWAGFA